MKATMKRSTIIRLTWCMLTCAPAFMRAQIVMHNMAAPTTATTPALVAVFNPTPVLAAVQARDDVHAKALSALRDALKQALAAAKSAVAMPSIDWPEPIAKLIKDNDATPLIEAAIELIAGEQVPRHIALALKLAEQAAAMNDPRATALLASAAANGWGQSRDAARARALVHALQQQGFARAYCLQAEWDARLPGGAQQRSVRALQAQGAEQGDAVCLNAHAAALEEEGHVEAARAAYTKAAEQGHANAAANLARVNDLMEQAKLRRDQTLLPTLSKLQTQAEQGNAQAQYDLARRLHRGAQAPKDLAQAFYWYSQAARSMPQAREVFGLIVAHSPALQYGEIDVTALQTLSQLPAVKSIEKQANEAARMPRVQQPPLRDASLLVGIEKLAPQSKTVEAPKTVAPLPKHASTSAALRNSAEAKADIALVSTD
jgi:TPR repeat protein